MHEFVYRCGDPLLYLWGYRRVCTGYPKWGCVVLVDRVMHAIWGTFYAVLNVIPYRHCGMSRHCVSLLVKVIPTWFLTAPVQGGALGRRERW